MGLLQRRTRLGQVVKAIEGVQLPSAVGSALAGLRPPRAVKSGATTVVAVTTASAAISALRRRRTDPGNDQ
jgi:hypothetical protein